MHLVKVGNKYINLASITYVSVEGNSTHIYFNHAVDMELSYGGTEMSSEKLTLYDERATNFQAALDAFIAKQANAS